MAMSGFQLAGKSTVVPLVQKLTIFCSDAANGRAIEVNWNNRDNKK